MKALVADDSSLIRRILSGYLEEMGILEVDCACDGAEALFKGKRGNYDVILLDWNMPKMLGIDVLRRLRGASDVPIIMVTTEGNKSKVLEAIKGGATDYLMKPFKKDVFFTKIHAVLDRTR